MTTCSGSCQILFLCVSPHNRHCSELSCFVLLAPDMGFSEKVYPILVEFPICFSLLNEKFPKGHGAAGGSHQELWTATGVSVGQGAHWPNKPKTTSMYQDRNGMTTQCWNTTHSQVA